MQFIELYGQGGDMTPAREQAFSLREYRGQFAHARLVLGLFVAIGAMVLVAVGLRRILPEPWPTVVLSAVGLAHVAFILMLPGQWKRFRARGLVLLFDDSLVRLVDTRTKRDVARSALDALEIETAEHRYQVTLRGGAGGTFRAPVLRVNFPGQVEIRIAAEASSLHWDDEVRLVSKPSHSMGRDDWPHLVSAVGLTKRLTRVEDARI